VFIRPIETTIESALRAFQYKLLNRAIATNKYSEICKIKESNLCNFCQIEIEKIEHLFWECPIVQTFWQDNLPLALPGYI